MVVAPFVTIGCASLCLEVPEDIATIQAVVYVDSDGELVRTGDVSAADTVTFSRPGDSRIVQAKKHFRFVVAPVNMAENTITVRKLEAGNSFIVTLEASCRPVVELSKKCARINWYDPAHVPEIVIKADSVDRLRNQIILTPLVYTSSMRTGDRLESFVIVGYEVRLGDRDECPSPAFDRWQKATKKRGAVANTISLGSKKEPRKIILPNSAGKID